MHHIWRITSPLKKGGVLLLVMGLALAGLSLTAAAQTDVESAWSSPLNLSHSGSATEPLLVVGGEGRLHVLWQDAFDGFVYARGDGDTWETSVPSELPFYTRRYDLTLQARDPTPRFAPWLVGGPDGRIHAFWRDGEGISYTSSVPADEFPSFGAWTLRQVLSESALVFDTTMGPDGLLHLVYLQTSHSELSSAGVYYRQWNGGSLTWSEPTSLYGSVYFRPLEPGDAQLVVAVDEAGDLHVAWDDPRLGLITHAQSADGGLTWSEPQGIVTEVPEELGPAAPEGEVEVERARSGLVDLVPAAGGTMHLVWQVDAGEACAIYHQISVDGGASWSEAGVVPVDECGSAQAVLQDEGEFLIHLTGEEGDLMVAWDGERWSEPSPLPAEFEDPETGRTVELGCVQVALWGEGRLLLVGCDQMGGGDIWLLTQVEGTSAGELFITPTPSPTSVWGLPVQVPLLGDEENPIYALHPAMAGDRDVEGRFHVVWSQPAEDDPEGPGLTLFYARWDVLDTERYPRAVTLFTSAEEKADQPALAADAAGRLHLVWSGNQVGEIRYSRAIAETAFNPTNWAEPQLLPMAQPAGSWPVVAVDRNQVVHVVYVVPLNEGRGVYHTCSADGGESWSEPTTIADGVEAGWAVVDHPTVAVGGDGTLHVAWSALPLPGSLLPGAIFYTHSGDCGANWAEPYEVAEGAVDWPQLAAVGALEVHLVYAETDGRVPYQHRWSADGGQSWSRSNWIPGLEGGEGPAGLAVDGAGRVHLAAVGRRGAAYVASVDRQEGLAGLSLQHMMWDGEHWIEVDGESAGILEGFSPHGSAVAVSGGDRLGLALAGEMLEGDEEGEDRMVGLIALLSKSLELPAVLPTPLPTLTPTPTPLPQPTPTQTPVPTSTPDLSGGGEPQLHLGPVSLPSDWAGLVVGAVPAAVVVLVAFVVAVLVVRAGRRYHGTGRF